MQLEGQRLLATSRETSSGNTFYDRLERQANAAMDDFMKSGEGIKLAATNPAGLAQKRDQLKAKLVLEALQLGAKDIPPEAVEAAKKTLAPSAVAPGAPRPLSKQDLDAINMMVNRDLGLK
jgi:hypothetical protein